MSNLQVQLGAHIQVLGILEDQVGFHRRNCNHQVFDGFERVLALAKQPADIQRVDNCVVREVVGFRPALHSLTIVLVEQLS